MTEDGLGVDVVVVTYQSASTLSACLASAPRAAIVIDNASSDGSAEIAESLGARVVRSASNLGFAAAANRGASLGRAPFVLFLNPDASLEPGALDTLLTALAASPDAAVAGPRLVGADGIEQRAWWPFPSPLATWLEALGLHRLRVARPGPRGSVPFVVGAAFLVRREAFDAVGGFDERFWLYGEEADLCRRLRDRGALTLHVPEAVVRHVGAASAASDPEQAFEHFQRGAERFVLVHHGPAGLVWHRLGLLVGSLVRVPVLAALGRARQRRTRWAIVRRLLRRLLSDPVGMPQ